VPGEKSREQIKVTDKRIFTSEGEIRDEFKGEIKPVDPMTARAAAPAETPSDTSNAPETERRSALEPPPGGEERRNRSVADKAQNPGTPFTDFVEPLIAQAYMSLGMLRNPYQPKPTVDVAAARQMIEIVTMLKQKTAGNLTPDEEDFLATHLGELKLAFVQRTKTI
jgi:hypothetical protein